MQFPLYAMRDYYNIANEGDYKVVYTYKNRYVLDYATPMEGTSYASRRISLLAEDLPYKLYPLKKRFDRVSQIVSATTRIFIDSSGAVVRWKLGKFYPLECKLIEGVWVNRDGNTCIHANNTTYVVSNYNNEKYAQVINAGMRSYLYDLSHVKLPTKRKKL